MAATEIREANSNSPSPVASLFEKEKDAIRADVSSDIEAEAYLEGEDDSKVPLARADKTELTPVEAFTWDVTGDQSPCESIRGAAIDLIKPTNPTSS